MKNVFFKRADQYKRDINPVEHCLQSRAEMLHIQTGDPIEKCLDFVRRAHSKTGIYGSRIKDPTVNYFHRPHGEDREKKTTTLMTYIGDSIRRKEFIAPTLTTYVNQEQEQSVFSDDIFNNKKNRSKAKKKEFDFRTAGDAINQAIQYLAQTGFKRNNNALSGARLSPSTPLFNPTCHSTLTSICRITSGYGNLNNEKFISGNRHYYRLDIVLNNIISIVTHSDLELIQRVIERHGLEYPTLDQVCELINRSVRLYMIDKHVEDTIREFASHLTPLQRAAFTYVGDLYHLRVVNPEFMRRFLDEITMQLEGTHPDPMTTVKSAPGEYLFFAHQICSNYTRGIGMKHEKIADGPGIHSLALTIENIARVCEHYADLIEAFYMTSNLPATVADLPHSMRRVVTTSDTDSTIFTVMEWVDWYAGTHKRCQKTMTCTAAIVFLTASSIVHILATMSANLGAIEKYIFEIKMKSEFEFDPFIPTNLGKHYFANKWCQEGQVFATADREEKGVYLINSALPEELMSKARAMRSKIMDTINNGEKIRLMDYLNEVAEVEKGIVASIQRGEPTYLSAGTVRDPASYTKDKENSPYQNHVFWNFVFGEKYGIVPEPPYQTLKISLTTDTRSRMLEWLKSMKDRGIATRLLEWMKRKDKTEISTIYLPNIYLSSTGVPEELLEVIDYEKMLGQLCGPFYLALETLGYYGNGERIKRLAFSSYDMRSKIPEIDPIDLEMAHEVLSDLQGE